MEAAEKHAESCSSCREILDDWHDIGRTARSMTASWESDLLQARIRRRLSEETGRGSRGGQVWRFAAAALLTISIGATAWYAVRDTTRDSAFEQKILGVAAVDEVERAEEAYLAAIERLEEVAKAESDHADTPLMVSYREKLMLIDDAIAEVQAGIDENRENAHLRRQLLSMYSEKQRTLQAMVREGAHVSNE